MEESTGLRESTERAASGDLRTAECRRGPTWRGWALSILVAIILWLCALAVGTVARAEEPPRPVGYYVDAALAGQPVPGLHAATDRGEGERGDPRGSAGRSQGVDRDLVNVPIRILVVPRGGYDGEGDRPLARCFPIPGSGRMRPRCVDEGEGGGGIRPGGDAEHAPCGRQDDLRGTVHGSRAGGGRAPGPGRPRTDRGGFHGDARGRERECSPTSCGGRWSFRRCGRCSCRWRTGKASSRSA